MKYFKIRFPYDEKILGRDFIPIKFIDTIDRQNSYRLITTESILESPPILLARFSKDCVKKNIMRLPNQLIGFAVDSKAKNVISNFSLPKYTSFYKIYIVDNAENVFYEYYIFHYAYSDNVEIDFKQSQFIMFDIITRQSSEITFKDYSEFNKFRFSNLRKEIVPISIKFHNNILEIYDIISLNIGKVGFCISDKLRDSLMQYEVSGLVYERADFLTNCTNDK